ncbi:hypothetical protein FGO68_gene9563 [Halteria grandinella]|uniref:Uncharacterized protein n=1 Tax=Halteria grandinella TaxID=5974 RepID=A0A8J8NAM9_HALGN|nr:hypothetical protein FGO68_gene9563 [Halteria grandinella]
MIIIEDTVEDNHFTSVLHHNIRAKDSEFKSFQIRQCKQEGDFPLSVSVGSVNNQLIPGNFFCKINSFLVLVIITTQSMAREIIMCTVLLIKPSICL